MITFVEAFCKKRKITVYWTSFYRPYNDGISKSNTHQTYRARDLSLKAKHGWTTDLIDELHIEVFSNFRKVGALVQTKKGLTSRPIYIHDAGSGEHAHFQVRP